VRIVAVIIVAVPLLALVALYVTGNLGNAAVP